METLLENTRLLIRLYYRPLAAMSGIMDEGGLLYAAIAAAVVSFLLQFALMAPLYRSLAEAMAQRARASQPAAKASPAPSASPATESADNQTDETDGDEAEDPGAVPAAPSGTTVPLTGMLASGRYGWMMSFLSPFSLLNTLATLALLYVPGTILALILLEPMGSFGVVLRRDYGSLLVCTLMAWAAAQLPLLVAGLVVWKLTWGLLDSAGLQAASLLYFAALMACALRTVFGVGFGKATGTVCLSWLSVLLSPFLLFLASPFLLYYAWAYFRGDVGDIRWAFLSGRDFRRHLESATINPRDAEAHYQLGLIHQRRRQITEAVARFKRAVEIDPKEADAHFQLGRIAREQGRLSDAIGHFSAVVAVDENHARGDVWREIGATYSAAGMFDEAREALERFVGRRPHDPEGLYYFGEVLSKLGRHEQAREAFTSCIESAKTMPYYRRREVGRWRRLAQKQMAGLKDIRG